MEISLRNGDAREMLTGSFSAKLCVNNANKAEERERTSNEHFQFVWTL